jgi:hypothetical protein
VSSGRGGIASGGRRNIARKWAASVAKLGRRVQAR